MTTSSTKKKSQSKLQRPVFRKSLRALDQWFFRQKRVLPWRSRPTLYRVWVSEIMLQQTQVATVIPYFERFMGMFPRMRDLAEAPEEKVLLSWAGLGYYSRARNLHRGAQQMVAQGIPRTREGWLDVPGVGPYTAGAVVSIALNQVEPILDGNVERVLSRVRKVIDPGSGKKRLWRLARIFVEWGAREGVEPRNLNQALMELGAMVCTPRNPKCGVCPLAGLCRAERDGMQEEFPVKKKKLVWKNVSEEAHFILDGQGRFLVEKSERWRKGLWDLPSQPPKKGAKKLGAVETRHVVTNHRIQRRTTVWRATERGADGRWVSWEELQDLPMGAAVKKSLRALGKNYGDEI